MTDDELEALNDPGSWGATFDAATRSALALADAMSGDAHQRLAPALVDELQVHYDEDQLAELILVAGQANLNNRAGNAAKQLLGPRVEE